MSTEYLNERLTKLLDESVSTENWLDVATGWQTILSLRAEMTAERGQAILDCKSKYISPLQQLHLQPCAIWLTLSVCLAGMVSTAMLSAGMCLDEALLQAIGAAHQFEDAIFPVDKPPDGFLKMLKTGLGGHLKAHGYHYRKMLDEELAKIKVSLQRRPTDTHESSEE